MWAGEQPSDNGQSLVVFRYPKCSPAIKETSSSALGMSSDVSLKILRGAHGGREESTQSVIKSGSERRHFGGQLQLGEESRAAELCVLCSKVKNHISQALTKTLV